MMNATEISLGIMSVDVIDESWQDLPKEYHAELRNMLFEIIRTQSLTNELSPQNMDDLVCMIDSTSFGFDLASTEPHADDHNHTASNSDVNHHQEETIMTSCDEDYQEDAISDFVDPQILEPIVRVKRNVTRAESKTSKRQKNEPSDKTFPYQKSSLVKTDETIPEESQNVGYEQVDHCQLMIRNDAPQKYRRCPVSDLKESLRYFHDKKEKLTLSLSEPMSSNNGVFWLRITRLCALQNLQKTLIHPYPIWIDDDAAFTYNQSLFIPVDDQVKSGKDIVIEKLLLIELLDKELRHRSQFYTYKDHSIAIDTESVQHVNFKLFKKDYRLNYSKLRFQIVLIESDTQITTTNLACETADIEAAGREPANVSKSSKNKSRCPRAQPQGKPKKRLQTKTISSSSRKSTK